MLSERAPRYWPLYGNRCANNKAPLLRVSSGVRMQSTNYELLALRGSRLSRYKRLDEGQTPPPDARSNHEGIGP